MQPMRALLPTLGIVLALGGTAAAQTQPTPEQAAALEKQITDWITSATAGAVKLPPRPVQLTPEGDHYLVRVPLAPLAGTIDPPDAAFTGKARQLDGTRWALDDQQFPPAMTFTTTEMVPDPPDAKNPSPDGTHKENVTYRIKLGRQDVHGVFDTSFATPTTSGGTMSSLDLEKEGGAAASVTHMDEATTQTSTRPVDPAHADLLSDLSGTKYSTKTQMPDGSDFTLEAERIHIVTALSGLAHDQMVPLFRLVGELANMLKAPGGDTPDGPTPAQKAKLHAMLEQAHAILTGAKLDESVEGVSFDIAGSSGTLDKAEVSLGGDAPADLLSASMGFSMDGLTINDLPPAFAAYVPTHFSIHPTVSNVSVATLTRMGLAATTPAAPGDSVPPPDVAALFANGGIHYGFDTLALDVAGAHLAGTGSFTSANPASVTGPGGAHRPRPGRADRQGPVRPDAATGRAGDHLPERHRPHFGRPGGVADHRGQRKGAGERGRFVRDGGGDEQIGVCRGGNSRLRPAPSCAWS